MKIPTRKQDPQDSKVRLHLTPAMMHAPIYPTHRPDFKIWSTGAETHWPQKQESSPTLAYFSKVTSLTESLNHLQGGVPQTDSSQSTGWIYTLLN